VRGRLGLILKLALAALLVTWLVRNGGLDLAALRTVGERWPWLVLAQLSFGVVLLSGAARWRLLLASQGFDYSFRDVYALTMTGWFFNQVMLGTVGGDVVKAFVVAREQSERRERAVLSVLVDRLLGLAILVTLAFLAFVVGFLGEDVAAWGGASGGSLHFVALAVVGIFVCVAVVAGLFFFASEEAVRALGRGVLKLPFAGRLERVLNAAMEYRDHKRTVLQALLLSFAVQVGVVVTNIFLLFAFSPDPEGWRTLFFLVPVAQFLMAIPLNPPAALGTGEAIYSELFGWAGIANGGLVCLLQRLTGLLWAVLGLYFYLSRRTRVREALVQAQAEAEAQALSKVSSSATSHEKASVSSGPTMGKGTEPGSPSSG